jgi:pSer/pThr/pTyr-binding forkhead associated (FHA) protein
VVCDVCKSDLPEGALFCGECGSSVRQSEHTAPMFEDSGLKPLDETSRDTQIVPRVEDPTSEYVAPAIVEAPRFADEVPAADTFTSLSELESLVSFTITLGTGESVILTQSALVGRMPQPAEGEQFEHLIVIADPGRSVSKTHLELGITAGQLWIADRNSGNGSIVREPGVVPRRAQPGTRYEIVRGTRIDLGDQHLTIS